MFFLSQIDQYGNHFYETPVRLRTVKTLKTTEPFQTQTNEKKAFAAYFPK